MGSLVRLNAALDWIDLNDRLADIGCDHGYLAIEALKKGIPFVQLIDKDFVKHKNFLPLKNLFLLYL